MLLCCYYAALTVSWGDSQGLQFQLIVLVKAAGTSFSQGGF